jgi:hypothetical protein
MSTDGRSGRCYELSFDEVLNGTEFGFEMLRPRVICGYCERAAQFAECDAEAEARAEEVAS